MAINRDGTLLATLDSSQKSTVAFYKLNADGIRDRSPICTYTSKKLIQRPGFFKPVWGRPKPRCMCFTTHDTLLIAGCLDGIIEISVTGVFCRLIPRHTFSKSVNHHDADNNINNIQRGIDFSSRCTFSEDDMPFGAIVVSEGDYVVVRDYDSAAVIRIIGKGEGPPGTTGGWRPHGVRFTQSGDAIVVADTDNDRVLQFRKHSHVGKVIASVPCPADVLPLVNGEVIASSPNTNKIWLCNNDKVEHAWSTLQPPLMLAAVGADAFSFGFQSEYRMQLSAKMMLSTANMLTRELLFFDGPPPSPPPPPPRGREEVPPAAVFTSTLSYEPIDIFNRSVNEVVAATPDALFYSHWKDSDASDAAVTFSTAAEHSFKARLKTLECRYSAPALLEAVLQFPGEAFLYGRSVSVALDATLDPADALFENINLDIFVLGSPSRKRYIVNAIAAAAGAVYGFIEPSTATACVTSPTALQLQLIGHCVTRRIRVVVTDDGCKGVTDALRAVEYPHLQCAYDGASLTIMTDALKAMMSRKTAFTRGLEHLTIHSVRNAIAQDYTVENNRFTLRDIVRCASTPEEQGEEGASLGFFSVTSGMAIHFSS
jgi:hypothetical protein